MKDIIEHHYVTRNQFECGTIPMAMTNAQRQAKYRARRAAGARPVRYRRPKDRRSRPERWLAASETLQYLQWEYREWQDSLPVWVEDWEVAERLRLVCDLDLYGLDDVPLPQGYGRDKDHAEDEQYTYVERHDWLAAVKRLRSLQTEYRAMRDSLPQSMQSSDVAERLRLVCDLDLSYLVPPFSKTR